MIRIEFDIKNNKSIAYDEETKVGVCEYIVQEDTWNIVHTQVEENYQGQGIAKRLVERIMEEAKKKNKKLIAECSYAKKIVEENNKTTSQEGDKETIGKKILKFWKKLNIFNKFSLIGITVFILLGLIAFLLGRIVSGIIAILQIIFIVIAFLMKKQIIKNISKWIPIIIITMSFIIIIPYFIFFKMNIKDYERYDWNEIVLSGVIEQPKSPYGKIYSNSNTYLSLYINNMSKPQFLDYVKKCKEKGFSIDIEQTGNSLYAYNSEGYKLSLYYYEDDNSMNISINSPMELGTLKWTQSELASLIPIPKSTAGNIEEDSKTKFIAYVGNTTMEEYNNYIVLCSNNGFSLNSNKTNKRYSAKNQSSYKIEIEYIGNNIMKVTVYEPEYDISVEIECTENWIFSKYDVKVYINNSYKGIIAHGGTETYNTVLNKGKYSIKFVSAEDESLTGNVNVDISKNETLKFKISCSSLGISVYTIAGATSTEKVEEEKVEQNVSNQTTVETPTEPETDNKQENTTITENTLEVKLEKTFSKEYARRAVIVAMTNGSAIDVFKKDGNTYDVSKFHSYADTSGFYLDIYSDGTWTAKNENTWHVENLKLEQTKEYSGGLIKVTADVTYKDGKYIVSKVHKVMGNAKYIDSEDPFKVSWEDLEPGNSTPYLTVTKKLIEKDRAETDTSNKLDEAEIIAAAKNTFEAYGKNKYPYGFKCHWIVDFIACEVRYDGSCYLKVGVTITNKYGTERRTVAEGVVKGSTVTGFYVSN